MAAISVELRDQHYHFSAKSVVLVAVNLSVDNKDGLKDISLVEKKGASHLILGVVELHKVVRGVY